MSDTVKMLNFDSCNTVNNDYLIKESKKGNNISIEYKVTYSNRKTIGIYVHFDQSVEVKCPNETDENTILEIINKKYEWIEKAKNKVLKNKPKEYSEDEKKKFIDMANEIIPKKVRHFEKIMNVNAASIRIGDAKSYWGCCSGNNRLTFSWRLMQASSDVIDYVVVHELTHIKEHNHSKRFWAEVKKVIPDYNVYINELKKLN